MAALVGDVEELAVGRELHVDRQAADVDLAGDPPGRDVDLDDPARVLAAHEQVPAVGREVEVIRAAVRDRDASAQRPRRRVAEVEAIVALRDDDGGRAVGREIEVVGVGHGNGARDLPGVGVDDRQRIGLGVEDVEPREVPRGGDVVGLAPHGVVVDDLVGPRIDDVDRVRHGVRHVDELGHPRDRRAQLRAHGRRVHVVRQRGGDLCRRGGGGSGGEDEGERQGDHVSRAYRISHEARARHLRPRHQLGHSSRLVADREHGCLPAT